MKNKKVLFNLVYQLGTSFSKNGVYLEGVAKKRRMTRLAVVQRVFNAQKRTEYG